MATLNPAFSGRDNDISSAKKSETRPRRRVRDIGFAMAAALVTAIGFGAASSDASARQAVHHNFTGTQPGANNNEIPVGVLTEMANHFAKYSVVNIYDPRTRQRMAVDGDYHLRDANGQQIKLAPGEKIEGVQDAGVNRQYLLHKGISSADVDWNMQLLGRHTIVGKPDGTVDIVPYLDTKPAMQGSRKFVAVHPQQQTGYGYQTIQARHIQRGTTPVVAGHGEHANDIEAGYGVVKNALDTSKPISSELEKGQKVGSLMISVDEINGHRRIHVVDEKNNQVVLTKNSKGDIIRMDEKGKNVVVVVRASAVASAASVPLIYLPFDRSIFADMGLQATGSSAGSVVFVSPPVDQTVAQPPTPLSPPRRVPGAATGAPRATTTTEPCPELCDLLRDTLNKLNDFGPIVKRAVEEGMQGLTSRVGDQAAAMREQAAAIEKLATEIAETNRLLKELRLKTEPKAAPPIQELKPGALPGGQPTFLPPRGMRDAALSDKDARTALAWNVSATDATFRVRVISPTRQISNEAYRAYFEDRQEAPVSRPAAPVLAQAESWEKRAEVLRRAQMGIPEGLGNDKVVVLAARRPAQRPFASAPQAAAVLSA